MDFFTCISGLARHGESSNLIEHTERSSLILHLLPGGIVVLAPDGAAECPVFSLERPRAFRALEAQRAAGEAPFLAPNILGSLSIVV